MKKLFPFLGLALLASSCHYFGGERVYGDGNVITQNRPFTDFNAVDVSSALDVVVSQDSAYSVKVEADNNLQELIEVYKDGEVLHIHQRSHFNLKPTRKIIVYVSAPTFSWLEASGACTIKSGNKLNTSATLGIKASGASHATIELNAPGVEVDLSGASKADLRGETRDLRVEGSGASDINAYDLLSENADVHVTGASNADVFASVKLEAQASGASDIRYKGKASVNSKTSGAGSVKKVD